MSQHDWTSFTRRIDIKADKDALYDAWATKAGIEKWFLRSAEFSTKEGVQRQPNQHIQSGDQYRWLWYGWPDEVAEYGTILQAEENTLVQFTFGGDPGNPMVVTVTFEPLGDGVLVELNQKNIPDNEQARIEFHLGCREGWGFYLANLKSMYEGGVDLRNRDESMKNMVNK